MSGTSDQVAQHPRRMVRSIDVDARNLSGVADGITNIYDDTLDVIVVRGAFDTATLAEAGERLDSNASDPGWSRPNVKMPPEDLQLLGTDTPATPTYQEPRGASLEAYLGSAASHAAAPARIFKPGFDGVSEISTVLSQISGARPAQVARSSDDRPYVPFTIRRLVDGKQIGIHHDYHYRLDLYSDLSGQVDTRTLISYVATLRSPEQGGALLVYGATSDEPDVPRLANGFSYDLSAVEERYDCKRFVMNPGDLFLLASGRCLHSVERISGPKARITMGGFLALAKEGDRVLYWS